MENLSEIVENECQVVDVGGNKGLSLRQNSNNEISFYPVTSTANNSTEGNMQKPVKKLLAIPKITQWVKLMLSIFFLIAY